MSEAHDNASYAPGASGANNETMTNSMSTGEAVDSDRMPYLTENVGATLPGSTSGFRKSCKKARTAAINPYLDIEADEDGDIDEDNEDNEDSDEDDSEDEGFVAEADPELQKLDFSSPL
ncbi:hypothetical protein NP233_g12910 [Leucocoprinus birnbaumii]|uniref:Uncharacterized protein n=1 Tax=Leucocoprinus birnbaumii TaxID=56174 RepID=A0AAD5YPL2_9AGAR|nr:hypothetical protein NP233_g12910 [Leucocoprinus birnbaumii]